MIKKLNWEIFSGKDRNIAIEEVKSVIDSSSGYIMNFNMFSDLALSLSIEIEESGIIALHSELSQLFNLTELDHTQINPNSKKEWMIFINISFSSGKGDLTNDIPDVPGWGQSEKESESNSD